MPAVSLRGLTMAFDGRTAALAGVDLDVEPGEFLVLLGPSGCGKTTILRCIAGLETPTAGRVLIDGADVTERAPGDRDVAMVFQNYALYPHLTARENIAFPLRMRGVPKTDLARRVNEAAAILGLDALLDRRPAQLSGGERQRVALGRAIVRQPRVFLFDEPLSNLDARLRAGMRAELMALHRRLGATMIFVTHDQVEAMTMGHRIAVLDRGRVQQVDTPRAIYQRPATTFVAGFVGTPGMNLVNGRTGGRADGRTVGFRPEDARIGPFEGAMWLGRVELVELLGSETLVHLTLDSGEAVVVRVRDGEPPAVDAEVGIVVPADRLHEFDAASGVRA